MQDGNDGSNQDHHRNVDEELRMKAIASEVVENVLRQAPHTAMERFTFTQQQQQKKQLQRLGELENLREDGEDEEEEDDEFGDLPPPPDPEVTHIKYGNPLQRLPTIQIDTVPSPPRSPDWPSPPPPEADLREDDELREDHIELSFEDGAHEQRNDVHKYAANYIDNLVDKAVQLAGERQIAEDTERAREIAAKVVEDVVSLASESASRKSAASLVHAESLPTFQIDTVASIPPSPESVVGDEDKGPPGDKPPATKRDIPEITYDFSEDIKYGDDNLPDEKNCEDVPPQIPRLVKFKDAPKQLQEFAKSYIKDVIARAVTAAEEKAVQSSPFNFDDGDLMKSNGPWYIRVREAFIRVLRTACFCTPRRTDS